MTTLSGDIKNKFFCLACLEYKHLSKQSTDDRYCQWCFGFLTKEAKVYKSRRPWMPRTYPVRHKARKDKSITKEIARLEKKANAKKKRAAITPQAATKNHQVAIKAVTTLKARKPTKNPTKRTDAAEVVTKKIDKLYKEGKTVRAIEKILAQDGIMMSYRTVARRLTGQRSMF